MRSITSRVCAEIVRRLSQLAIREAARVLPFHGMDLTAVVPVWFVQSSGTGPAAAPLAASARSRISILSVWRVTLSTYRVTRSRSLASSPLPMDLSSAKICPSRSGPLTRPTEPASALRPWIRACET